MSTTLFISSGGGVSPSVANTWTAAQTIDTGNGLALAISGDAPNKWNFATGQGSFNDHIDDLLMIGYNVAGAGALAESGDWAWHMGFERDYWDTAATHQTEWYIQYINATNTFSVRPIMAVVSIGLQTASVAISGRTTFLPTAGGAANVIIDPDISADGNFSIRASPIRFETNGKQAITQMNAAGDSYTSLIYLHPSVGVAIGQLGTDNYMESDLKIAGNTKGLILADRSDGHTYRIKVTAGVLGTEQVT